MFGGYAGKSGQIKSFRAESKGYEDSLLWFRIEKSTLTEESVIITQLGLCDVKGVQTLTILNWFHSVQHSQLCTYVPGHAVSQKMGWPIIWYWNYSLLVT